MEFINKKKLNKEQIEAIKYNRGPLLIIAGAGTGKTTVLTERIKWLITTDQAKPGEILALTFTQKAAIEMEERVDIVLPYGLSQIWITTFHAFGEKVLRQEAMHIGLDSGYKLMTEAEAVIFFRKNLFKFNLNYFRSLGNPNKFIEGILQHFNRLKDEDITPPQYIKWVQIQQSKIDSKNFTNEEKLNIEKYSELALAYQKYEELKIKEGVIDFSDLIAQTLTLFRKRKNVLREYQERFKYILIDEFQDTNFAQNELAVLLAGKRKNITVVGDDDQAIYRWRGAAVSNIIQFKKRFPKTKIIVLSKNYRSTQKILDSSYRLIQFNNPDRLEVKEGIVKKLIAQRKVVGEEIGFIYTQRVEDEAAEVVKRIENLKKSSRNRLGDEIYKWRDFALLLRANNQFEFFSRAFHRAGIPYQFLGPGMLFRQSEVKDLIAYLKLLNDFTDSIAVFRVLSMSVFGISARDLTAINSFAQKVGISIFEAIEAIVANEVNDQNHWSKKNNYDRYLPFISKKTKETLIVFLRMVNRHLELVRKETAGQILYFFLEETGILKRLTKFSTVKEERTALNISKFFNKLKTYEIEHEDASVQSVVDWINMSMELGESPLAADIDWTENDAVNILTVHSSKGLEFPVVFLVNLVNQRFPTLERKERIPIPDELIKEILPEGDYHLEEERRLFYVGMTRAKDYLFFTASKYYGEGKRERQISTFVREALSRRNFEKELLQNTSEGRQLSLIEWKKKESKVKKVEKPLIDYFSYSQINTFLTCPLQYKYKYILKIPVPPSAAGSFGTSMHMALEQFYSKVKKGEKPEKKDLLELLNKVWLPIGYGSLSYEKKMKKRGEVMLASYYDKFYQPDIIPKDLEFMFKIKLTPNLKIGGKIDRVDETKEGKLEIIDYKTGKRPSDKEIKEDLQMSIYALVAIDKGIYHKKPNDIILSFYFLDSIEKVSSTREKQQLEETKKKLVKITQEIALSQFEPKVGKWCDFCDFRLICEAWR